MTCFFDASHGPATQEIMWTPQWGTPRPVRACAACAQRWTDHLQGRNGHPQGGYPQPGYPQPGYAQPGYPPPVYPEPEYGYPDRHRHGYGLGTVAAAGAAGFVGGMVVNELLDDYEHADHVEVIEHVVDDDYGDDYSDVGGDW